MRRGEDFVDIWRRRKEKSSTPVTDVIKVQAAFSPVCSMTNALHVYRSESGTSSQNKFRRKSPKVV
jgi:hypothetical protein